MWMPTSAWRCAAPRGTTSAGRRQIPAAFGSTLSRSRAAALNTFAMRFRLCNSVAEAEADGAGPL